MFYVYCRQTKKIWVGRVGRLIIKFLQTNIKKEEETFEIFFLNLS